ncbi:hypothetical protein [Sphingomonas abietis]|uniref:Tat pathway signal protein n=1 Tax=Sphingomonas abietis TaxID=3012344 RepID=A0ABY7NQK8_9SPHN|nr:hypothetical protein [Sphingomonas abietis]WBO23255.1 hypothetical protein PBT88_03700 [Sphingomonas abietis]
MNRRDFLQSSVAGAAAASTATALRAAPALPRLPASAVAGHSRLLDIEIDGERWTVWEDLRDPDGAISFVSAAGTLVLAKRTEAMFATADPPHLGLAMRDIALADADLLADALLAGGGDPDPDRVRDAAPPSASNFKPDEIGTRLPWTALVGTKQAEDTMPVFRNGRTRTYRPEHRFPELSGDDSALQRREGLLGGWLPAVHKVIPRKTGGHEAGGHWDLLVFADVDADNRFIVETWHRTLRIEQGRIVEADYGHSYAPYPPRRQHPTPEAFYTAMFRFARSWQAELAEGAKATLPDPEWTDMVDHAFAKELVIRPNGVWPKYGAVDRDYYGSEYDGFQDTFTSSLYANLLWGRFAQARAVLDQYFTAFVLPDGLVDMRGPETAQYGLTLALLARYLRLTGDLATLVKHRDKIRATVTLLTDLHDQSLALPAADRGFGLIHGWNESDSCLHPDPTIWWKPYWANSAFAVRGWREIAAIWPAIGGSTQDAADWSARATRLQQHLEQRLRANIRHDLTPPYVGPLPGVTNTFREALTAENESEQGWPHRAYAELLQPGVLPPDLEALVVDCLRGHGGTTLGVVANIGRPDPASRDILGFISYGYAEALLRLDRIEEYLLFLYSHRFHAHTRGSWMGGEVSGIDGGLALFCIPAQLTIPKLVRWMLVYEDQDADRLHLARAVPTRWIMSGQPIAIRDAPTRWGKVGFSLRRSGPGIIEGEISLPAKAPRETLLRVRLPADRQIRRAFVDGKTAIATAFGDIPIAAADHRVRKVRIEIG